MQLRCVFRLVRPARDVLWENIAQRDSRYPRVDLSAKRNVLEAAGRRPNRSSHRRFAARGLA